MRYQFNGFEIDTLQFKLFCANKPLAIEPKDFDLIVYLLKNRHRTVTRDEIFDTVWQGQIVGDTTLSNHIRSIRKILDDNGDEQSVIATLRGRGYQFVAKTEEFPDLDRNILLTSPHKKPFYLVLIVVLFLLVSGLLANHYLVGGSDVRHASIAVLPFVNMSSDPEQEYFSDGLTDTLLHMLSQIDDLTVASRTSSFSFKGSIKDIPYIGKELKVNSILEGSVQKSADQLRIIAQLVKVSDGSQIWSKQFNRKEVDIFAIYDEIAIEVVRALKMALPAKNKTRLTHRDTENVEAYTEYLLGREQLRILSVDSMEKALKHFNRATEIDPHYALAYAAIADAYLAMYGGGVISSKEIMRKTQATVERAQALDYQLGSTYRLLALSNYLKGDYVGTDEAFQQAAELGPNKGEVLAEYSHYLLMQRRLQKALEVAELALSKNPLSPVINWHLSEIYNALGQFEKSKALFRRFKELDQEGILALWFEKDFQRFVEGRPGKSILALKKGAVIDPNDPEFAGLVVLDYLDLGDDNAAEAWSNQALQRKEQHAFSQVTKALLHAYRGQPVAQLANNVLQLDLDNRWGSHIFFLRMARDGDLENGDYAPAIARYIKVFPQLSLPGKLKGYMKFYPKDVTRAAIDLATVFIASGEHARAHELLNKAEEFIQDSPRLGTYGYGIADVEVLALKGQKQLALDALRQAVNLGWRANWWWYTEKNVNLKSLHGEPEYQALIEEIKADMTEQLEQLEAQDKAAEGV